MRRIARLGLPAGLLLSALLALAGCGGGSSDDDEETPTRDTGQDGRVAQMRFINAIPDAPIIEMLHDGRNSARFTEFLNFGEGSNRKDFVIGNFFFNFSYVDGTGTRQTLYEESDFALADGNELNYIMIGALSEARLLRVDNPEFLLGLDDATADVDPQIQFVHTAVGIGPIDFYLTENGAELASAVAQATLNFGEPSAMFDIQASESLQLRAFAAGSTTELLYDSGSIAIARTTRSMILAANYFGPVEGTASGVELLRFGASPIALTNANQPATLRVHNVVADETAVDVYLGTIFGSPAIANVEFGGRSDELQLPAQTTDVIVTSAGNQLNTLTTLQGAVLSGGTRNTVYVGGVGSDENNNNEPDIGSRVAQESTRTIAEGVPLRLFNGSTINTSLAVYLLRPGQSIQNTTPTNLAMGDYAAISLVAGEFDIVIVESENQSTIFGPERVVPVPNTALNIVVRDTFGGTTPVQVDLVVEPTSGL